MNIICCINYFKLIILNIYNILCVVASNFVRGNLGTSIKFNLFHNNTVFIRLYIITYYILISYIVLYIFV